MHKTLQKRIDELSEHNVLDPLRSKWPNLLGCAFKIKDRSWGVLVTSNLPQPSFPEVAPDVRRLFCDLGFEAHIQNEKVHSNGYTFELIELHALLPADAMSIAPI